VLAAHYEFKDEELDFTINYDIKYRMAPEGETAKEGTIEIGAESVILGEFYNYQLLSLAAAIRKRKGMATRLSQKHVPFGCTSSASYNSNLPFTISPHADGLWV
jgi:hypothetical protein